MGQDGLALSGMDDAGKMSSWYVLNALGLYPYSPADPRYIISIPLFRKTLLQMGDGSTLTIQKNGSGERIAGISYDGKPIADYFVGHSDLEKGKELMITAR